jgi:hypothetical protein
MSTAQIADRPRTLSAAEVDELDPYAFFAVLGKRVIHPGGRTATDELIRKADFQPASTFWTWAAASGRRPSKSPAASPPT